MLLTSKENININRTNIKKKYHIADFYNSSDNNDKSIIDLQFEDNRTENHNSIVLIGNCANYNNTSTNKSSNLSSIIQCNNVPNTK